MSIRKQRSELLRLQKAFEDEAGKFHEITLSIVYLTQTSAAGRAFRTPNHGITLWQYYGTVSLGDNLDDFRQNLAAIDGDWESCKVANSVALLMRAGRLEVDAHGHPVLSAGRSGDHAEGARGSTENRTLARTDTICPIL